MISHDKYQKELDKHDWYYIYSDDQRVWERGNTNEKRLLSEASADPELLQLYKKELAKHFNHQEL